MQRLELKMCFSHTACKAGPARCLLPLFPYQSWSKVLVFSNEPPLVLLENTKVSSFIPLALHVHLLAFFRLQNIIYANQLLSVTVFRKSEKVSWSCNWKTSLGSVRDAVSTQKPWNKEEALEGLRIIYSVIKTCWCFLYLKVGWGNTPKSYIVHVGNTEEYH